MKTARRDVLLMALPVAFIALCGWHFSRKPAPVAPPITVPAAGPFRLRVAKLEKLPLTPRDVARGGDTKIGVAIETTGTVPPGGVLGWEFVEDANLIGEYEGKPKRLIDLWGRGPTGEPVMRRGGGGGGRPVGVRSNWGGVGVNSGEHYRIHLLRLRAIPARYGALKWRSNVVFVPRTNSFINGESDAERVARSRRHPLAVPIVVDMPLRKAGETTPRPRASTDPLFDIRKIEIVPAKGNEVNTECRLRIWIYYRGPVTAHEAEWGLSTHLLSGTSYTGGLGNDSALRAKSEGGLKRFIFETTPNIYCDPSKLKQNEPFYFLGEMSVKDAWPRRFEIPLKFPLRRQVFVSKNGKLISVETQR